MLVGVIHKGILTSHTTLSSLAIESCQDRPSALRPNRRSTSLSGPAVPCAIDPHNRGLLASYLASTSRIAPRQYPQNICGRSTFVGTLYSKGTTRSSSAGREGSGVLGARSWPRSRGTRRRPAQQARKGVRVRRDRSPRWRGSPRRRNGIRAPWPPSPPRRGPRRHHRPGPRPVSSDALEQLAVDLTLSRDRKTVRKYLGEVYQFWYIVGMSSYGAQLVREARRRAGLTQVELAERAGTGQPTIARWESGRTAISVDDVVRLVRLCGLDVEFQLVERDTSDLVQADRLAGLSAQERLERLGRVTAQMATLRAAGGGRR